MSWTDVFILSNQSAFGSIKHHRHMCVINDEPDLLSLGEAVSSKTFWMRLAAVRVDAQKETHCTFLSVKTCPSKWTRPGWSSDSSESCGKRNFWFWPGYQEIWAYFVRPIHMFAAKKFISYSHSGACSKSLLACFLQASADILIDAKFEKPKLATLCMQLTLENTGLNQTSRTLVQIQNFCHHHNQQVMYFTEMYSVFTGTFSRSGRTSGHLSMRTDTQKKTSGAKETVKGSLKLNPLRTGNGIHAT